MTISSFVCRLASFVYSVAFMTGSTRLAVKRRATEEISFYSEEGYVWTGML